jgi:hypothetical protein
MKRKKLKHEFVLVGCLFTKFTWSRQLKIYKKKQITWLRKQEGAEI